jgi:archaeosine-15-forming tRNA-guanine transglycosylase
VVVPRGTAQVRVGARTAATDGRLVLLDGAPRAGDEVVARDAEGRVLGRGRVVLPLDERLARGLAGPP